MGLSLERSGCNGLRLNSQPLSSSGENAAISLAQELHADSILLDDRKARLEAMRRGLAVAGTINILDIAAAKQLLDLPTAFRKLRNTNFRVSAALLQEFLDRDAARQAKH